MIPIKTPILKQLLMDLRFSPLNQKLKQLKAAEELLCLINPDNEYPFEFVCFKITGYRPQKDADTLINGQQLKDDISLFITRLSAQINQNIKSIQEPVYSIFDLAKQLGVSTRTIQRWRKRGLVARKFIFDDGSKKIGFLKSSVDNFCKLYPDLIERACQFNKVDLGEKSNILSYAQIIANESSLSRQDVISKLSAHFKRSKDTIRRTILEYESDRKNKPIFNTPSGNLTSKEEKNIYQAYQQNTPIKVLMNVHHRSKSSIYRIVNKRKVRELKLKKIDFMHNDEFLNTDAEMKILSKPLKKFPSALGSFQTALSYNERLPQYINSLKSVPPLTREVEIELFRRYNFLKFAALKIINGFPITKLPPSNQIKKAQKFLDQADQIRKILIESNMRLVISIANRHCGWGANVADLISEGNFSLMHAIEKFDYSRGFRFSTYASLAISKDYARRIPAETSRPDKAGSVDVENLQFDFRKSNISDIIAIEDAHKNLEYVIKNNLTDREQYIIFNHYGLTESKLKKKNKSLKQIGFELSLSKERVRQIELLALQKLRHIISPEEFDLLTG